MTQTKSNAKASYTRGQRVVFQATFKDENGNPYTPLNTATPEFAVYDPENNVIASGVGTPVPTVPGCYRATVFIPADAPLTYDESDYRIEWIFLTDSNDQLVLTDHFQVTDSAMLEAESRAQQTVTLVGRPFKLFIKFLSRPHSLKLNFYDASSENTLPGFPPNGFEFGPGHNEITEHVDNGMYVYVFEGTFESLGSAVAMWEYYITDFDGPYFEYEIVHAIPMSVLPTITQLRQLIDKFQAKFGTARAYEDAELYEYIQRGTDIINGFYPVTNWSFYQIPAMGAMFTHFLIYAAAWHGLNAQYLLEGNMAFNYSGLSTTLDVDRTGYIESELQRLYDYLQEKLPKAKMAAVRQQAGVVTGRPMNYIPQVYPGNTGVPRLRINYTRH